jgi:hypothetical protein
VKKITKEYVRKIMGKPQSATFAMPYPGRHPLRVWWKVGDVEYLGKLTPQIWREFNRRKNAVLWRRAYYFIFDRAGMVAAEHPRCGGRRMGSSYRAYTYFAGTEASSLLRGVSPFQITKVGKYVVYATTRINSFYLETMRDIEAQRRESNEAAV